MVEFLKQIVLESAKITSKEFQIFNKDQQSDLVTNLDIETEKFIIDKLKEKYPNYDIVSEEFNSNNMITKNCFIIDPIDGTINFANGSPIWSTQIACVENGKTIASVIYIPRLNELYYADNTGAYMNGKKIHINEVPTKNALFAIEGIKKVEAILNMTKYTPNKRHMGAISVSLAFMAIGRLHGVVYIEQHPWDYEPGLYIIKQAGGIIKNIKGFHAGAMNKEFLALLENETKKISC